jgi:hypothetical protein
MFGTTWLAYFEGNARDDRAPGTALAAEVPEALRGALAASLGRFQLGESAGGKIHEEMDSLADLSLDQPTRRSIQLYIEEEWRHSRELAMVIGALGGRLLTSHWTNGAFTACRRLLGLRTKMMTLAAAEVVGIVYYRALASHAGSSALGTSLRRIAHEEALHLDFQAAFFEHTISLRARWWQAPDRVLLKALMGGILTAALAVLLLDHGRLLTRLGVGKRAVIAGSWHELRRRDFLRAGRLAVCPRPGYALAHER